MRMLVACRLLRLTIHNIYKDNRKDIVQELGKSKQDGVSIVELPRTHARDLMPLRVCRDCNKHWHMYFQRTTYTSILTE